MYKKKKKQQQQQKKTQQNKQTLNLYSLWNNYPQTPGDIQLMSVFKLYISRLFAYCKGGNFNIHNWAWSGYFIC